MSQFVETPLTRFSPSMRSLLRRVRSGARLNVSRDGKAAWLYERGKAIKVSPQTALALQRRGFITRWVGVPNRSAMRLTDTGRRVWIP